MNSYTIQRQGRKRLRRRNRVCLTCHITDTFFHLSQSFLCRRPIILNLAVSCFDMISCTLLLCLHHVFVCCSLSRLPRGPRHSALYTLKMPYTRTSPS